MSKLSIVGGGAWGVALSKAAAAAKTEVLLYTRRPHPDLPESVKQTDRVGDLAKHARTILLAVPSNHVRELARELGDHVDGHHILVHGIRGLVLQPTTDPAWEGDDLVTISAVLREETPARKFGALGGPVLTDELAAGAPSVLVAASHYPEVLDEIKKTLGGTTLRVYTTDDLLGLEWAAALTSILAIAIGFARGAGIGAGLVSAFAIRGVHEAARVGMAAGANERTFLGLGGFGDLLAAMSQGARPEVRFGEALAKGDTIEHALSTLGQRIEAIDLAPRVAEFATRHKVQAPILTTVADGILARKPLAELVAGLMTAPISGHA
jgi:glycerol-3-phosphate dehydrogenase (NAD(P)+)